MRPENPSGVSEMSGTITEHVLFYLVDGGWAQRRQLGSLLRQ
jgi:hypothetical protein